jgi:cytoskeletal protein RodZ
MVSIGKQLKQRRLALGLSLDDVAFRTHIAAARLGDMENDDLSQFANLTYAKGFLKLYSRHLDLDLREYLDEFDTSELASASGHEYVKMGNAIGNLSPLMIVNDAGRGRLWATLGVTAVMIAAPVLWWWSGKKDEAEPREAEVISEPVVAAAAPAPSPSPAPPEPPPVTPPAPTAEPIELKKAMLPEPLSPLDPNAPPTGPLVAAEATSVPLGPVVEPAAVKAEPVRDDEPEAPPVDPLPVIEAQLKRLRVSLRAYADANDARFPREQPGLSLLISANVVTDAKELLDPWGKPLIYRRPGVRTGSSYDLYSRGPDGIDGNEDDVISRP